MQIRADAIWIFGLDWRCIGLDRINFVKILFNGSTFKVFLGRFLKIVIRDL